MVNTDLKEKSFFKSCAKFYMLQKYNIRYLQNMYGIQGVQRKMAKAFKKYTVTKLQNTLG